MADDAPNTVVVGESQSALNIVLHPLVVIGISDHYTRRMVQTKTSNPRVFGALIGKQVGRDVDILSSFELPYNADTNALDLTFLATKMEQMQQVFSDYECLGWYSTSSDGVGEADLALHQSIIDNNINDSPLCLVLNPLVDPLSRELPIQLFESELRIISDAEALVFVTSRYKIESEEAERIAVDHVANVSSSGGADDSALKKHLGGLKSAVAMLNQRLLVLARLLRAMQAGEVPVDHATLRLTHAMCNRLPAIDGLQFRDEFLTEYNDALLVAYLATITKGASTINDLIDKFNISFERNTRRRQFF